MTQVDFAIITTRADEFAALLQHFPARVEKGASERTYGISQIKTATGTDCIVALGRSGEQGTDAAQQIANDMISDLNPQVLLVVGIASGVPNADFTLGDVIVSTSIINFNMSRRYEDSPEKVDIRGSTHPVTSEIATTLSVYKKELKDWDAPITLERPTVDLAQFDADTFKKKIAQNPDTASWYEELRASITSHFAGRRRPPLFETGITASSNTLIRNLEILVEWLQNERSILAVEMETAGAYQATQSRPQQYPVMAIRGISEIIGFPRDKKWAKYASQAAAAFAHAFITAGIIPPRATTARENTIHWENIQSRLRDKLVDLFSQEASIRAIVWEVDGTLESFVAWNGNAVDCWSGILREVRNRHLELELVESAQRAYPRDELLQRVKGDVILNKTVNRETTSTVPPRSPQRQALPPQTRGSKRTDGIKPVDVFISYAEYDEKFKQKLDAHLAQLSREGIIRLFSDQQVVAGQEWGKEIARHVNSAQVILLLMSPSYLASDHLYENEMMRVIERQQSGEAVRVIPIMVRPVNLSSTLFQRLQGLPRNGIPIATWRNPDDAWASIAQEIRLVCEDLRRSTGKR